VSRSVFMPQFTETHRNKVVKTQHGRRIPRKRFFSLLLNANQ